MEVNGSAKARATWELTVLVLDKIPGLNRQQRIDNRWDAKLDAATHALAHLEHNDVEGAIGDLYVFVDAVGAQAGTRISRASAYELNAWAEELMHALGVSQTLDGVPAVSPSSDARHRWTGLPALEETSQRFTRT